MSKLNASFRPKGGFAMPASACTPVFGTAVWMRHIDGTGLAVQGTTSGTPAWSPPI